MIQVPFLSWVSRPKLSGPVAQVVCNFAADNTTRVDLKGGYQEKIITPSIVVVDNMANPQNCITTFGNVASTTPAQTRNKFPLAQVDTLDAFSTGTGVASATLTFYADERDAPADQPNFLGLITQAVQVALAGQTVANLAALKALAAPTGLISVVMLGRNNPGDGGFALYWWNAADARADNGFTIIQPVLGGNGRWNRL